MPSNATSLMPNYARQDLTFVRGRGVSLWTDEGIEFLDGLSGIAVCNLGHAHPKISEAIAQQADTLMHVSNLFHVPQQQQLADRLTELSGLERAFFCNSGAEANEALIKLARLYAHHRGIQAPKIVVMDKSFHGRTLATLSASGNRKIQAGFAPLVSGFLHAPYDDLDALATILSHHTDVVAILVEPVQGEGGVNVPKAGYLAGIRALCDRHQCLMLVDEVQTGLGRTGQWFAFQHEAILPDAISLAKGLGNGIPIGACLATAEVGDLFQPGTHGTTFGGNPLVCRVALTVLDCLESDALCQNAQEQGQWLATEFKQGLADCSAVVSVRQHGLMLGIELDQPYATLGSALLEQRVLVSITAEKVVRLLPPLILNRDQARQLLTRVITAIQHTTHSL